jgi:hypothetical protein
MLKKYVPFFLTLILSSNIYSQNMNIVWQKVIGGNNNDFINSVVYSPNNSGVYLFGNSTSNVSGDKTEDSKGGDDIWVVKVDNDGLILWDKTIGGSGSDSVDDVIIHNDTIFLLGKSSSVISGDKTSASFGAMDVWLVALDLDGNILYDMSYGGTDNDYPKSITYLNNNLLIGVESFSDNDGNKATPLQGLAHIWLLTVETKNGAIINQYSYGTSEWDIFSTIKTDKESNIFILGATFGEDLDKTAQGNGGIDVWLIKLDQNFNEIDQKCFGGNSTEYGSESDMLIDDDYIYFVCSSQSDVSGNKTAPRYGGSTSRDFWLVKLDLDMNIIWDKSFGGTNTEQSFVIKKSFDKIVVGGSSRSAKDTGTKTSFHYGETDVWLIIVDENGNEVAQQSYGGTLFDSTTSFIEDSVGNLIIAGSSNSPVSGTKTIASKGLYDYWLIKINAIQPLSTSSFSKVKTTISVFPNPTSGVIKLLSNEVMNEIEIIDITGKSLHKEHVNSNKTTLNLSHLSAGIYFANIKTTQGKSVVKFVVE